MALARYLVAKIYEIKAHDGKVKSLDLGETGRVLVTGGQDRNVNLWAIGQEECFMSLAGHNRPIECVRFAYNDDFVYSADDMGIIRRWDLNAQTMYSTLNGHMKSVRTLDFDPAGEFVVSGSNDTTVRLWDVHNRNKCVRVYRGHISHVNSVKFSPDGLWIASAGSEGSVIIWDMRKSQQIMNFTEETNTSPVTCIQFHPFEFLLAVGRDDGTVCIYDLENKVCISRTEKTSHFYGHSIKCITFSENGECLFVGTTEEISVIGWEPDREFDNIKSNWTSIADLKVINNKLICGCYENDYVTINGVNINRIIPFYNPSNNQISFNHNSVNRKSFSRANQKLRISLNSAQQPAQILENNEEIKFANPTFTKQLSPNPSLELGDDSIGVVSFDENIIELNNSPPASIAITNIVNPNPIIDNPYRNLSYNHTKVMQSQTQEYNFSNTGYNIDAERSATSLGSLNFNGPSSLRMPEEYDEFSHERGNKSFIQDNESNLNDSNPPVINNYDNFEIAKDFPVKQNNLRQKDNHVPKTSNTSSTAKLNKKTSNIHKRNAFSNAGKQGSGNKLSSVTSMSSMELNSLDDNMLIKKSASSHLVINKNKSGQHTNKENTRDKNINVQIITKPPIRSRTSLDIRTTHTHHHQAHHHTQSSDNNHISMSYRPDLIPANSDRSLSRNIADDDIDINALLSTHEVVLQELSNRHANLQLLQNFTRSHDVVGALKKARKISDRTVFVDLLGSILEKPSAWNLDLCLFILPEIYELLQSHQKFHYIRACDTLRVILSNFLPIIQENLDAWSINGLGVDVTREDRQRKCVECQRWLIQIRNLPNMNQFGTTLTQLQNMIVI